MREENEASTGAREELRQRIVVSDASLPDEVRPFDSEETMIEMAYLFLNLRDKLNRASNRDKGGEEAKKLAKEVEEFCSYWHRAFGLTDDKISFCVRCNELGLSEIEREILMVLLLDRMGLIDRPVYDCGQVLSQLSLSGSKALEAIRAMSPNSRLAKENLIFFDDPEMSPRDRHITLDPLLVDSFISGENENKAWDIENEDQLYDKLRKLIDLYEKKVDSFGRGFPRYRRSDKDEFFRVNRRIDYMKSRLQRTLDARPEWGLSRLMKALGEGRTCEKDIVLALLSKELGHREDSEQLFEGRSLARIACDKADNVKRQFDLLRSDAKLIENKFVQPCGGAGALIDDTDEEVAQTEYELAEKAMGILDLERREKKDALKNMGIREPKMRFDQLVLSPQVRHALDMALAQARNAEVLVKDWGLGDVITYGRAVTLLFSGPPGTGKTASAEALASELECPLLVADYSKIQNCFVGVTEKNIVKIFRQARSHGAVLFWDEADAMFYDRDMGHRSWEVRDVNVLLQELERFDGVCILASNRKCSLDKALERRVSVKVEYERPDAEMRRKIWEKLVPENMPLAGEVDFGRLSEADLSGGEIKNAVLNAARIAVARGKESKVKMSDFARAIDMETDGKWSEQDSKVGFIA